MTPERISEIATDPAVPKFIFGSEDLKNWHRKHRCPRRCEATTFSGWYVVIHQSLNPQQRPDFQVLSQWSPGQKLPTSFDVPTIAASTLVH